MLTQHIALVPESDGVDLSELARVSAALQKQVMRDVAPLWGVSATVDAFPRLEDVPIGYWPVLISRGELGREAGLHLDESGQPYAQIQLSADWSFDASRICLEMLLNPFGDRTVSARSLRSDQGMVEFLVEATAACEDPLHRYSINDVLVSDFCTPAYFGAGANAARDGYSFRGALKAPFQLRPGGHVTWYDSVSNSWWLRDHWDDVPVDTRLGAAHRNAAVRELVYERAPLDTRASSLLRDALDAHARASQQHAQLASQSRAQRLRAELGRRLSLPASSEFEVLLANEEAQAWPLPRRAPTLASDDTGLYEMPSLLYQRYEVDEQDVSADDDDDFEAVVELMHEEPAIEPKSTLPIAPASAALASRAEPAPERVAAPMSSPFESFAPVSMAAPRVRRQGRDGFMVVGGALAGALLLAFAMRAGGEPQAPHALGARPAVRQAQAPVASRSAARATEVAATSPVAAPSVPSVPTPAASPARPALVSDQVALAVQTKADDAKRNEGDATEADTEARRSRRAARAARSNQPAAAPQTQGGDSLDSLFDSRK